MDMGVRNMDQFELGEKLREIYFEKLKFCGCGRPQDTMLFIKDFLNVIYDKFESKLNYDEYQNRLKEVFQFQNIENHFTDTQYGIFQFVAYYLDEIGIIEHGGGIGGAWLSDVGKQLRDLLNNVEDFETIMD